MKKRDRNNVFSSLSRKKSPTKRTKVDVDPNGNKDSDLIMINGKDPGVLLGTIEDNKVILYVRLSDFSTKVDPNHRIAIIDKDNKLVEGDEYTRIFEIAKDLLSEEEVESKYKLLMMSTSITGFVSGITGGRSR